MKPAHPSSSKNGAEHGGAQPIASLRVINLAMAAGVLVFAVIATLLGPVGGTEDGEDSGLLFPLLGVMGAMIPAVILARVVVGSQFQKQLRAQSDVATEAMRAGKVPVPLASLQIIGSALFEAVGILGCVILLLTGHWAAYVGIVVSLLGILFHHPLPERIEVAVTNAVRG